MAIVGTRNASVAGTTVAASVAREMSARGRVVVSGLARGIDRAAHAGAVQRVYMGPPAAPTVAVLAHGLHRVYPEEHARLADEIVATGGALVSAYPPGVEAAAWRFVERDSVIAFLASALFVVESSTRGGAMHAASSALRLRRPVVGLSMPGVDASGADGLALGDPSVTLAGGGVAAVAALMRATEGSDGP